MADEHAHHLPNRASHVIVSGNTSKSPDPVPLWFEQHLIFGAHYIARSIERHAALLRHLEDQARIAPAISKLAALRI